MKTICVLGAGVVGLSTAYALARNGHNVIVVDQNDQIAGGASQANGAQLSYSYVDPFANPQILKSLPRYLLGLDPAIQLRPKLSLHYLMWGLAFINNCRPSRVQRNLEDRAALAKTSALAFDVFFNQSKLDIPVPKSRGKLVLLPDAHSYQKAVNGRDKYLELGLERMVLDKSECLDLEPNLSAVTEDFAGGVFAPSDFAFDPVIYCEILRREGQKLGVDFRLGTEVKKIGQNNGRADKVITSEDEIKCDAMILCLGNGARKLAKSCGISLPIYPIQGYSLTMPLGKQSPNVSVTSLRQKLVYANLGTSLRIAGFMDANQSAGRAQARMNELLQAARAHWPGSAEFDADPNFWTHFRPMTPRSMPVIKESPVKNLYLNVGHGALGYTFAAGSAMIIADAIGQAEGRPETISGGLKYAAV